LKVECCQSFRDGKIETLWCTQCDNTVPPSNCGPRYEANRGVANPTGVPTPAGNALPPPGSDTGPTIKVPPGVNALPNATNALPPGNSTGTLPPGSIIKVPPGTIGSATNPPPTNNNTGNPIAMKSSDNPPGCSKKDPIPLNCTLNPFNNLLSNKAQPQQTQTQQTTAHHHKGSNTGASTSTGSNSTGH
jgi:hypothetical protein